MNERQGVRISVFVPFVPNVAILNQFLPIINHMRSRSHKFVFIGIFDKPTLVDFRSDLVVSAEMLIDEFWILGPRGVFFRSTSLRWASLIGRISWRVGQLMEKFGVRKYVRRTSGPRMSDSPKRISGPGLSSVCFADPFVFKHKNLVSFLKVQGVGKWFLMPHGNYLSGLGPKFPLNRNEGPIHFFATSRERYLGARNQHGLTEREITLIDDPTFSVSWLRHCSRGFDSGIRPYVYLTSRPAFAGQMEPDEKSRIFKCVALFCHRNMLDLRIRPHPKEHRGQLGKLVRDVRRDLRIGVIVDQRPALLVAANAVLIVNLSISMDELGGKLNVPSCTYRELGSRMHWRTGFRGNRGAPVSVAEHEGKSLQVMTCEEFSVEAKESLIRQNWELTASGKLHRKTVLARGDGARQAHTVIARETLGSD